MKVFEYKQSTNVHACDCETKYWGISVANISYRDLTALYSLNVVKPKLS